MPDGQGALFPLGTCSGRLKFHVERERISSVAALKDLDSAFASPEHANLHAQWRDDQAHFTKLAERCGEVLPYLEKRKVREERHLSAGDMPM